jgi:single-stranded-DNA-specific exonuclease
VKFGGHRQAAGLTLDASKVTEFRERLNAYAASVLTPEDLRPNLHIDAMVDAKDLDLQTVAEVFSLAPFGFGNPSPTLAMLGAEVVAPPQIIKEKHLRVRVRQQGRFFSAMGWHLAELAPRIIEGSLVDLAFALEEDDYSASRGYEPWQAILKDVRVSL